MAGATALVAILAVGLPAQGQYIATESRCIQCHITAPVPSDFLRLAPGTIWEVDDKHNRAFWLLHETNPASPDAGAEKRTLVARILGFELPEAFADGGYQRLKDSNDSETVRKVTLVKSCLRCHATWPKQAEATHQLEPPVPLASGVSCQACHGPGNRYFLPHGSMSWRLVTPEGKRGLDFYDVRTTTSKARLCASCHVGDVDEGKFVTHAWYAAGHPPLPSFELATLEAAMPAHWTSLKEKRFLLRDRPAAALQMASYRAELAAERIQPEHIRDSYLDANFPDANTSGLKPLEDLHRAKNAIVAGVIALEAYTRLIAEHTRPQSEDGGYRGPEFALYDCAACHHRLQNDLGSASRPKRASPPGRPPLARWPKLLTQLAALQAAGYDPEAAKTHWSLVEQPLSRLERATTERPFGSPAAMHRAANELAEALKKLADDAANTRYDPGAVRAAAQWLTTPGNIELNDYATARQAAWTLRQLALDLDYGDAQTLFANASADPLHLALPRGQQERVMDNLPAWLSAAAAYDASWFKRELEAVPAKLPK
jgi:mono/diheme cytochrome c family protein